MKEEVKESLDLVVGYTQKFIDAVTPVAKQAYEIGLVTLQIDAAQSLIIGFLAAAFLVVAYRKGKARFTQPDYDLFDDPIAPPLIVFGTIGVVAAAVATFSTVLNVWVWTKLLAPELWLAHQAVEKLLK